VQKQRIILIIGIVLAVISLVLVRVYIAEQDKALEVRKKREVESFKTEFKQSQTSVLIAKQDIPRGATVEPENLEIGIIPREYVQPQAVTSLDRIAGMITIAPVAAGEQLSMTKLSQPRHAGGLAEVTPVGKRAVTMIADNIASLVGMVKPGDYVDVITLLPVPIQTKEGQQTSMAVIPLFQNVLVLAVGRDIGGPLLKTESRYKTEQPVESSPLITLALSPQEANLIAFAQEQGKIRLILRSPADSQVQPTYPASWDTLFQYIMPVTPQAVEQPQEPQVDMPVEKPKPPKEEGDVVEIYRGLNKDTVVLPKS
jgi:pilus assembly protein CpaB